MQKDDKEMLNIKYFLYVIGTIAILIGLSLIASILSGCSAINNKLGLADDNLGEEIIEFVIESKTGADIDLTPASPE